MSLKLPRRVYLYPLIGGLLGLGIIVALGAYYSQSTSLPPRPTTSKPAPRPNQTSRPTNPNYPVAPKTAPNRILFSDPLSGSNRIVVNEFTHWSPRSGCPYSSPDWDMTSGTLLVRNGAGYSGIPTAQKQSVCDSAITNNSATFRLNTKNFNFTNVSVAMDYMAVAHGGGGAPQNSYDGIHIWVGYQSQYALYVATIYRWDNVIAIKKKVPQAQAHCPDPANEGCYYDLAKETIRKDITTSGVWHHAAIQFSSTAANLVTITIAIDKRAILTGVDANLHGKSYPIGAVGVRGDNTEFYFKNFSVDQL